MEDKIFKLLNKMYGEFSRRFDGVDSRLDSVDSRLDSVDSRLDSVENRLDGVDSRLDGVDSRLDGVENRLRKVESLIENDVKKDISSLYDGYRLTYEEVADIKKSVNEISVKVDKQDVEIRVIKGGEAEYRSV